MSSPSPPSSSRAQLAAILADTTKEVETLRKALNDSQRRAAHFEALCNSHQFVKGSKEDALQNHLRQLEQRVHDAEIARDTELARRVALTDLWGQYKNYVDVVEAHARDARAGFDEVVKSGGGVLHLTRVPRMEDVDLPSRTYQYDGPAGGGRIRRRSDSLENVTGNGHSSKRARNHTYVAPQQQQQVFHQQRHTSPPPAHALPPPQHRSGHGHHSPSSNGSMDVDEMLIQASTSSRSTAQRYQENPYPGRPYAQPEPPTRTLHVFAPIVTGNIPKKQRTVGNLNLDDNASVASGPPSSAPASAASAYPATNSEGQRICRQCGMAGRYKEGKCVEKWGPGPCGPGTVCDRCRKKMKRVERRGTLEQQQHQQQQHFTSQNPAPIARTDTVLSMGENGAGIQHSQSQARLIASPRPPASGKASPMPPPNRASPRPPVSRQRSPLHSDEDGDADADADADDEPPPPRDGPTPVSAVREAGIEIEADLLEAVEAAEASDSDKEKERFKNENANA